MDPLGVMSKSFPRNPNLQAAFSALTLPWCEFDNREPLPTGISAASGGRDRAHP